MSRERVTAFPDGNSFVKYHGISKKLIIGNSEGLVKIFNVDEPDLEPVSIDIGENLTSISAYRDHALVTNTCGNLEIVNLRTNESEGSIYRSELPLRDSKLINEGKRAICGGDDTKLVLIDLGNNKAVSTVPLSEQLLDMAYNMTGEILSVSLTNGSVQIYSVINEIPNLISTISDILKVKINSSLDKVDYVGEHREELFCTKTQWSLNGELLLIPTSSNTIKVYDRSNWSDATKEIRGKESSKKIIDFELSPNNKYLAICYEDLTLYIYDFDDSNQARDIELSQLAGNLPTNIAWSDGSDSEYYNLSVGTTDGDIFTFRSVTEREQKTRNLFLDEEAEEENNTDDLLDNSDGEGEENGVGKTNGVALHEEDSLIIDEDEDDNDGYPSYYNKSVEDHFDGVRRNKRKKLNGGKYFSSSSHTEEFRDHMLELQPYSQGSTPWSQNESNLTSATDRRYLCMNSFGYIWAVKTSSNQENLDQQSITVSFFDRSINKDYHFIDYYKFDLCSINESGVVFASSGYKEKDAKFKGKLFYRHHESIQDSWERTIPLLRDEYISSVSITNSPRERDETFINDAIIIVGTNFGYIRSFNIHGLCINIMKALPVVALMSSSTSLLFMINQMASNVYAYSMIDTTQDYKFIQQDVLLPLNRSTKMTLAPLLKGMFFNEYNDPCLVPSIDETLIILSSWRDTCNARWTPLLNCKEAITEGGKNDSKRNWKCWPLGLYGDKLSCLILKSESHYPGFPLPLPVELAIKIPVSSLAGETNGGEPSNKEGSAEPARSTEDEDPEECFLRMYTMGRIASATLNDAESEDFNDEILSNLQKYSKLFDRSLLKLFASACQESRLNKALSIAKLIKNDKALAAAFKIAERFDFLNLARKINKLREDLADLADLSNLTDD